MDTEPELIEFTLKDETVLNAKMIIREILRGLALSYTATAAAAAAVVDKV